MCKLNADLTAIPQHVWDKTIALQNDGESYYVLTGSVDATFNAASTTYVLNFEGASHDSLSSEIKLIKERQCLRHRHGRICLGNMALHTHTHLLLLLDTGRLLHTVMDRTYRLVVDRDYHRLPLGGTTYLP